ncbi:hypothetical protein D6856_09920 [Butyrivibrio sp. XB500-5]|uniref:hypothetical protein n=1 Tax=Butyrivibrio sp. XB500-5 TaxID=2364880 RepID=UPI000EA9F087|nr:hypothetical protein [Butyrivibrio sp. XB500-5]RKM59525.1 hypothetical protein D6856_09920 [Butyrivibrio sp. XB500-5]
MFIVIGLVGVIIGIILGEKLIGSERKKAYAKKELEVKKFRTNYYILLQWLNKAENNRSIGEYLASKGYKKIAIYGMGELGELLLLKLRDTDIEVPYAIDKNAENIGVDVVIKTPNDDLPDVDAVIVTTVLWYWELRRMLKEKLDCDILSLEDIVYEM